ncbi:MAG: BREX-2 system adenine-specific DNA-methyltransferase PglX [Thiocapsa sp.]|uniref:BREX-2 system adenine-specific DNA-methyltransferase PglX n=1 Tax=Thiocapsa sp. TaxID=2024551 RepID=UPI001BCB8E2D|nr:BREX-2 system adenine-specific DNA-methyltransferase PglX [Thiocapsa sp.]QVL47096.1 MAG: BREX-2 system adenine-specific DNA-methyltransferase PglX [Thiocapsa sp.]
MIDGRKLLDRLRGLQTRLVSDLRERIDAQPEVEAGLRAEWQRARETGRIGQTYADWREDEIAQATVHWVLACVFLRFIEDNGLVERPWLSGATRHQRDLAQDRHDEFFRARPLDSDRDYLLACFEDAARLPGMGGLFDRTHNPLWRLSLSGDGAVALLRFWQQVNPDTGELDHDFRCEPLDTRFLGDLYQDLSEPVRKKYALLQTPEFVEEFILDRTLTPALAEVGYREIRLIDPTCGSGHFLLGAFRRLFDLWAANEPARNLPDLAQRALDAVYGVDINPYAVAIARFRLTMAAIVAAGIGRLADAPDFQVRIAVGDSLLHGRRFNALDLGGEAENLAGAGFGHAYATEDLEAVNRILGQRYHAVVGNPPYITVKDPALNGLYRGLYKDTCHMKYSLVAPFTERFFDLAVDAGDQRPAGYVGLIVADSFMKREFGKKLIENFLPRVDLTHVIATSGAYIPGHGTPTVILFGRNRRPLESVVRTVMGIKGEPATPDDPAKGLVWTAILEQLERAGSVGEFVSVSDVPRGVFGRHPWSIGGGGAADLREFLDSHTTLLRSRLHEIGFGCIISEEEAFQQSTVERISTDSALWRDLVVGDTVRDWGLGRLDPILFPYTSDITLIEESRLSHRLWWSRTLLGNRRDFGNQTYFQAGRPWWEYHQIPIRRNQLPLSITFADIATHNHFVLDRGGKVFNRTAPVIKLPAGATEDDHLALLGLLNSSTACFWLKQVCHNKGSTVDQHGARQRTAPFEDFYAFNGTKVQEFPLVDPPPTDLASQLDTLARELAECLPAAVLADAKAKTPGPSADSSGGSDDQG